MKHLPAILLVFTLVFTTQISFAQKESKQNKTEWKTYKSPGYSIDYPADWMLDESGQAGTAFIFFSPLESEDDEFSENVNFIVQDLQGMKIGLDEYTEISVEQVNTYFGNSTILENKRLKKDGKEFHKLVYTGVQGQFDLHFHQHYWIFGGKAFVLTFTTEKDKYQQYKDFAEKIMNSFKLI